jgi:hypothetical protein
LEFYNVGVVLFLSAVDCSLFGVDESDNLYETSVIVRDVGHGIKAFSASDCSSFGVVVVVVVVVVVAIVAVVAVGVVVVVVVVVLRIILSLVGTQYFDTRILTDLLCAS